MTQRVAALVVGAGVSGLVCTYALRKAGVDAVCVEASDRAGGAIRTERRDGYLLEFGPQSFSGTAQMLELFDELNISNHVVQAPVGAPRYVLINGALQKVPMSPPAFLSSGFVGMGTKFALLQDVVGHSSPPDDDESIAEFVRRKFSAEMLDRLVGPFVSGVYAGDPEKLSLRSAFPTLYDAEKRKGSVIRGMLSKPKDQEPNQPRRRPTLFSFREGTTTFTDALAARLGDALHLNTVVRFLSTVPSENGAGYQVTLRRDAEQYEIDADQLILATPTFAAGILMRGVNLTIADRLSEIEYASTAVVSLGYRRSEIGDSLDGFGFLIPRSAGIRTLGSVWNTSLFPNRAPEGHALLTNFIGGATDPQAVEIPGELASIVHKEISSILKIHTGPAFSNLAIYQKAIPQYNLGHAARLATIEEAHKNFPNLHLVGNYLRGPSIGACVEQSLSVAAQIAHQIAR